MEEKRPVPRRSIHVLFTKKRSKPIERGNQLLKRVEPKHVHLMTARVSTLKWHMIERGNPLLELTREPCKMEEKTSRSQEIDTRSFHEEAVKTDRTGQPVVETSRTQTRSFDDSKSLNVEMAHDRTGQPVVGINTRTVQDGRKTSRSQEIDTRSFHEEAVKTDRTGQPVVETSRTQTRSSDDSKSLNVEMAHDRTGQPVVETNTENVPDGC